jgi:hypothetical protein
VINPDAGCGWDGFGQAQAACMKDFVPGVADLGDMGQCVQLCGCQAPCFDLDMVCAPNPSPALVGKWGKAGYCKFKLEGDGGSVVPISCP